MQLSAPQSGPILPSPLPPHPRLLAQPQDWDRLRKQIESDPVSARIFASLQRRAIHTLSLPPCERVMVGRRLLHTSREVLERMGALAMAFQLSGDPKFSQRAIVELKAVCHFSDWNPIHYLDVAEMSLAVALAYDWLYDELDGETRDLAISALLEKGINPSLTEPPPGFITSQNNWNQVCHAGMTAAAIAIAEREPEISERIIRRSIDHLHLAADAYAPDGAYPEGPMYWNYGTSFHVLMSDALLRLTGSTQGTDAYEGFVSSADYVLQTTTPTGAFYSYADCRRTRHMVIPLFWFASRFQRPDLIGPDLEMLDHHLNLYDTRDFDDSNYRLLSLALLWRDPSLKPAPKAEPSRHWLGRGIMPVAIHRSALGDPQALYAGIKGGSPSWNHAHMDAGSFMLQCDGVTWATDLGMQDYESLESISVNMWAWEQDGTRWKVFRLGPESHNILRFNQELQQIRGHGEFIRFQGAGSRPHSVLDLGSLYAGQAESVKRGLMMIEDKAVLIQDEWRTGADAEVTWQWVTPAEVSVEGTCIHLRHGDKSCLLQILDSPQVQIESAAATAWMQPYDAPNPGIRRITLKLRAAAGQPGSLRVLAIPGSSGPVVPPFYQALEAWSAPLPVYQHPSPVFRE